MTTAPNPLPFLWGAQYYRAPTPDASCWEGDLRRMRELGFTDVKFWVQWRWAQRAPERFVWDDLDRLLDLAQANQLRVTLNTIFDVAPLWLYRRFPDARQITADGRVVETYALGHRQIGGGPGGPCYNHPGARAERERFLAAAVARFAPHPALAMWDVWNEPEQSFPSRDPRPGNYVCYCANCLASFVRWLQRRYASLTALNQRWGRCYEAWDEVEAQRVPDTIGDWIDWREFQLDTMAEEARWRLALVEREDPRHVRYLHVVPNTMDCFNAVSGIDDFDVARGCQVFASTMNASANSTIQTVSAGHGKVCYNVESHVDYGSTNFHQRVLGLSDLRRDLLPQIGLGVKGFLFWQYRAETLGLEAPAWGLVRPDGSDRPVTLAARRFGEALAPQREALMRCAPAPAPIAIWKSRQNELFHHAIHGGFGQLVEAIDGYVQSLYWSSHALRYINERMLAEADLAGVRLLIMPSCYWLSGAEAAALRAFVARGGVVLAEAHLGGYDGDAGRHSQRVPGLGLDQAWDLRELESTSSHNLKLQQLEAFTGELAPDVRKALAASGGGGGQFFPIDLVGGGRTWGSDRFAMLGGEDLEVLGSFAGMPCIATKELGAGALFYVGTRWGQARRKDPDALTALLGRILARAGVTAAAQARADQVHVDVLRDGDAPRFVVAVNRSAEPQPARIDLGGRWRGIFDQRVVETGADFIVPAESAELFVPLA